MILGTKFLHILLIHTDITVAVECYSFVFIILYMLYSACADINNYASYGSGGSWSSHVAEFRPVDEHFGK